MEVVKDPEIMGEEMESYNEELEDAFEMEQDLTSSSCSSTMDFENCEDDSDSQKTIFQILDRLLPDYSDLIKDDKKDWEDVVHRALNILGDLHVRAIGNHEEFMEIYRGDLKEFHDEIVDIALSSEDAWDVLKYGGTDDEAQAALAKINKMKQSDMKNFANFCGISMTEDEHLPSFIFAMRIKSAIPEIERLQLVYDLWKNSEFHKKSCIYLGKQMKPFHGQKEYAFNHGSNYFYMVPHLDYLRLKHLNQVANYLDLKTSSSVKGRSYELKRVIFEAIDKDAKAQFKISNFCKLLRQYEEQETTRVSDMSKKELVQLGNDFGISGSNSLRPHLLKPKIINHLIENINFPSDETLKAMEKHELSMIEKPKLPILPSRYVHAYIKLDTLCIKLICLDKEELQKVMRSFKMTVSKDSSSEILKNQADDFLKSQLQNGKFNIYSDFIEAVTDLTSNGAYIKKLVEKLEVVDLMEAAKAFDIDLDDTCITKTIEEFAIQNGKCCPIFVHFLETLYTSKTRNEEFIPQESRIHKSKLLRIHKSKLLFLHFGKCHVPMHQSKNERPDGDSKKAKVLEILFKYELDDESSSAELRWKYFPFMKSYPDLEKMIKDMVENAFDPSKSYYSPDDMIWQCMFTNSMTCHSGSEILEDLVEEHQIDLELAIDAFKLKIEENSNKDRLIKVLSDFLEEHPINRFKLYLFAVSKSVEMPISTNEWPMITYELMNLKSQFFIDEI